MEDVDKTVTRKILTVVGYINGFGKEETSKIFLHVKVNPLHALVAPNYAKKLKYVF